MNSDKLHYIKKMELKIDYQDNIIGQFSDELEEIRADINLVRNSKRWCWGNRFVNLFNLVLFRNAKVTIFDKMEYELENLITSIEKHLKKPCQSVHISHEDIKPLIKLKKDLRNDFNTLINSKRWMLTKSIWPNFSTSAHRPYKIIAARSIDTILHEIDRLNIKSEKQLNLANSREYLENLYRLINELEIEFNELLMDHRWIVGNRIIDTIRILTFQKNNEIVTDHIQKLFKRFNKHFKHQTECQDKIESIRRRTSFITPNDTKLIVYTCLFGDYEKLKEPLFQDKNVQYLLFTDNPQLKSRKWKKIIVHTKLENPRRTSRLPKILAHKYLPPHDVSIYIDASLEFLVDDPFKMAYDCLNGADIGLYKHYRRNCVYDEIKFCKNRGIETESVCQDISKKYKKARMPENFGLFENGLIVRRNNNKMRALNEKWWQEYTSGSERDQFSLAYSLWQLKIRPNPIAIGLQVRLNPYVNFYHHNILTYPLKKGRLFVCIAYAPMNYDMNLGRCYNDYMEMLDDNDFILFLDHDAVFCDSSWREIIQEVLDKYGHEEALFTCRTNRIGNPYQRINLLCENHHLACHRALSNFIQKNTDEIVTEITTLPSSSGVVMLLNKKTWKKYRFSEGFLKVDNKMHIALRENGGKVFFINKLYVYHFYRADNDASHALYTIEAKNHKNGNSNFLRNFVYQEFNFETIDSCMSLLDDGQWGLFLRDQSMFCNKDWYHRACDYLTSHPDAEVVFFMNNANQNAIHTDNLLEHRKFALTPEINHTQIDDGYSIDKKALTAFMMSKRTWRQYKERYRGELDPALFLAFIKSKNKTTGFCNNIYVYSMLLDSSIKLTHELDSDFREYFQNRLNIAIITIGFWPDMAGMELMTHNLASNLTNSGNLVVLFAPQKEAAYEEIKHNYLLRRFKDFDHMKQMFHVHHASLPFDVIFVQGAHVPAGLALELREETGIPVVIRTHGEDIQIDRESDYGYRLNPQKNKLILDNLSRADCNIAIGPHVYEELSTLSKSSKTALIFNGVDTDLFYPAESNYLRSRLGIDSNHFILLTVGRNVKKKSLHYAIEVLSILRERGMDVVLVHVGKEGNGKDLKSEAARCNVQESFYQLGIVDYFELPMVYRSADLFVFPSRTETFGNVTTEAMACGLPCIEFDYIVNQHKIDHGLTGYILPYGDVEAMADAVQDVLEDPEKRKQFARAGVKKIHDQFSWKSVAEQYNQVFHRVSSAEPNQAEGDSSTPLLQAVSN